MKKLSLVLAATVVCAPLWMSSAHAQFAKPEDAIKYRQSALSLLGTHMSRLQPVLKGQVPFDAAAVKANVAVIQTLSTLPWTAFVAGTHTSSSAKPEIWSDAAGFKAAHQKFEAAVVQLSGAADSGDLNKLRSASGEVGASCKACHDSYRAKK
jgi:cytochrome c556